MSAAQLLATNADALAFLRARASARLRSDSRCVEPGDAFVAWPGSVHDARAFVADALARGARAALVEADGAAAFDWPAGTVAALAGLQRRCGAIASAWMGEPSTRLAVLAVTGTNGKTSSAWWIAHALDMLSKQKLVAHSGCGLVGTLGTGVVTALEPSAMTTPDPLRLQQVFADCVRAGLGACAIEASSIGLAEERLAGTRVHTALFTNLTQDHLDWHADMQRYWRAKRALFDWPGLRAAVVNVDDAHGAQLQRELSARAGLDLWSVSLAPGARLVAQDVAHGGAGLAFSVVEGGERLRLQTRLVGLFNVANLLGVIACLRTLGVALADAVRVCAQLAPVPGRMQQIARAGQPLVVVDYAHTPDALVQALAALRPLAAGRGGRLWCVFGCGGDRDPGKRPLMGAAAQHGADRVLVTSDNPRSEDARAIVHQILQGMIVSTHVQADPDRASAIAQAIAAAAAADVVLIAGKGHEDYQEIDATRRPFSDLVHAERALARRGSGA